MNIVLTCAFLLTMGLGTALFFTKNCTEIQSVIYIPQTMLKPIYFEPPSIDKIKSDLAGKTIMINGQAHKFIGPEINKVDIQVNNPIHEDRIALDVNLCADLTVTHGFLNPSSTNENVCGILRIYYDKNEDGWKYDGAESINLKKVVKSSPKVFKLRRG